jgi:alkyl sulfatase BDS1-like metallo-beta-lactamase superfamily hydrolase
MAENATHNLHNLLTLRGALVRDPHIWAHYLTEAIELFAGQSDVVFASHHWPTWGTANIIEFLSVQRDLYAYLHDQTLRLLNQGYTGPEIAEMIELPPPWSRPGTPTATTARSATTSRPSTSATWAAGRRVRAVRRRRGERHLAV